jgi:2-hydroxy-6-oxonona-2,4-dienedioate hydrolase
VRRVLRHILPVRKRRDGLLVDMQTAGAPTRYDLERVACPVLAISAKDDLYGTAAAAAYTAAQVRQGKLIMYSNGGHILAGRNSEAWLSIASFLRTIVDGPLSR